MRNIMAGDAWDTRRKNLEDAFFAERDRELLEKLRHHYQSFDQIAALRGVSGIKDEKVLQTLIDSGVGPGVFTALMLVPLVEVAWSDGHVEESEKDAVLRAAETHAIPPGTPPHQWLEQMLVHRPDPSVLAAWKEYVSALVKQMPPEAVAASKNQMLSWVTSVAEAAGGILGFGNKISTMEQATIHELARAYGG
jgi:hypothetical protein